MKRFMKPASQSLPVSVQIVFILLAGLALRLICAGREPNYDIYSYRIVADIVARGGNVYAETTRYNYGPVWFHILHWLDMLSLNFSQNPTLALRWKVVIFLSLIDIGLFVFLVKGYSVKTGALFFLNPVSIIITGYHGQFDNFAVFLGAISAFLYENKKEKSIGLTPLVLLGISLTVKHILFLFPLWLAFKAPRSKKLAAIFIPYFIFFVAFLPYLAGGFNGILNNVFMYRSYNNAPFWMVFAPCIVVAAFPPIVFFIGAMFIAGLSSIRERIMRSYWIYLICLVVFSSAIANQYLAICISAIAVYWNRGFFLYSLIGAIFLVLNHEALHLFIDAGIKGYYILIPVLAYGFILMLAPDRWEKFLLRSEQFFVWLYKELRSQII